MKKIFIIFILFVSNLYLLSFDILEPVEKKKFQINTCFFINDINPARQISLIKPELGVACTGGYGITDNFTILMEINLDLILSSGLTLDLTRISSNVGFILCPVDYTYFSLKVISKLGGDVISRSAKFLLGMEISFPVLFIVPFLQANFNGNTDFSDYMITGDTTLGISLSGIYVDFHLGFTLKLPVLNSWTGKEKYNISSSLMMRTYFFENLEGMLGMDYTFPVNAEHGFAFKFGILAKFRKNKRRRKISETSGTKRENINGQKNKEVTEDNIL